MSYDLKLNYYSFIVISGVIVLHSIYLTEPESVLFSVNEIKKGFTGSLNGEAFHLLNGAKFHRFELKDRLKPGVNTLSLSANSPSWVVDAEIEIQSKNSNGIALPAFRLKRHGKKYFNMDLQIHLRLDD